MTWMLNGKVISKEEYNRGIRMWGAAYKGEWVPPKVGEYYRAREYWTTFYWRDAFKMVADHWQQVIDGYKERAEPVPLLTKAHKNSALSMVEDLDEQMAQMDRERSIWHQVGLGTDEFQKLLGAERSAYSKPGAVSWMDKELELRTGEV